MDDFIDCRKVYVGLLEDKGYSAFARQDVKKNELIEKGLVKIVDTDGNKNPFLFTWSEDKTKWAYASGCATFYNTSLDPNCIMKRNYSYNSFTIHAIKDIKKNDELTHLYQSLEWRDCFNKLNDVLQSK